MVLAPDAHMVVPKVDLYVPQGRRRRHSFAPSGEPTALARDMLRTGKVTRAELVAEANWGEHHGAEYGGEAWHDSPEQGEHDQRRRAGIRRLSGYAVDVLRRRIVFGAQQDVELILRAGVGEALTRSRRSTA